MDLVDLDQLRQNLRDAPGGISPTGQFLPNWHKPADTFYWFSAGGNSTALGHGPRLATRSSALVTQMRAAQKLRLFVPMHPANCARRIRIKFKARRGPKTDVDLFLMKDAEYGCVVLDLGSHMA